jgi:hypothetical protein
VRLGHIRSQIGIENNLTSNKKNYAKKRAKFPLKNNHRHQQPLEWRNPSTIDKKSEILNSKHFIPPRRDSAFSPEQI